VARRQAQAQETTARQAKLAALRAQEARKRRQMMVTMGAIGLVLVVIVAFIIAKAVSGGSGPAASGKNGKVVSAVTSIPQSVFDKVGTGALPKQVAPQHVPPGHALASGGKPEVLYVGAEYCPYCATERWPVVAALSRFGTFHDLGTTRSSSTDAYPNTATLSFHGASYDSKYLNFQGFETSDRQQAPLDSLPPAAQKAFRALDAPPFQPAPGGSIPFIDFAGKYMIVGASYDPQVLQGKNHLQIAQAMHDPSSDIAQGADATANMITAMVCTLTNQQPAKVCNSSGVQAAATKFLGGS
jgi:hypothetical protein